jgi:hypothetical protein
VTSLEHDELMPKSQVFRGKVGEQIESLKDPTEAVLHEF